YFPGHWQVTICLIFSQGGDRLLSRSSVRHANAVAGGVQCLLDPSSGFTGRLWSGFLRRCRRRCSSLFARSGFGSYSRLDRHRRRRPRSATIRRTINPKVSTKVNQVGVASVLKNRISDKTIRHTAHGGPPRFAVISTNKKKSATGGCVYCRGIDPVGRFAIGDNHVGKSAAVSSVGRYKV